VATIDDVRSIIRSLPGARVVVKWGRPHATVANKIFAGLFEADGASGVKATPDEQAALVTDAPETFSVAPYMGRHGWVLVRLERVELEQLRELIIGAWRRTAPRWLVDEFDADGEAEAAR
jgi:hypothetical protein